MEKSIVFFDIDGTLVGRDRQVTADNRAAVKELQERGHLAVINTGRPYRHIEPNVLALGFDGFVCGCGGHIILNGESVVRRRPSAEVCREMIELVRRCRMSPIYESEDGMFFDYTLPFSPDTALERRVYEGRLDVDFDIDTPGFRFDKFCAYEMPDSDLAAFRAGAAEHFEVVGRENHMWEMPARGCSKAEGIRLLCEHTGIPVARCLAIGDGRNDVPMFRACGHSAVMGDGDETVFHEAEFVTAPLYENGVRRALEHFGLI